MLSSFLPILALTATSFGQGFVSPPRDLEVVLSERFPGAKISYKKVENICETTEGVASYSGYVELPKDFIPDAKSWPDDVTPNFYFWYFEARNNPQTAPTSIYLGGGPGYTTFDGSDAFPCFFNPDSNSTTLNKHSFNNHVNMLYIDQPLTTGLSYTSLGNGTFNPMTEEFVEVKTGDEVPPANLTTHHATINNRVNDTLTLTTKAAARTFWRFAQVWFNDFPEIRTENNGLNIWAVSYGGLYAPLFASYIVDQNALIREEKHTLKNATSLNLTTVGIVNGLVEMKSMLLGFADFSRNNTYGLELMTEETVAEFMKGSLAPKKGCLALIDQCRAVATERDPEATGSDKKTNEVCGQATKQCFELILGIFGQSSYWHFDITMNQNASFPNEYNTAFLNQDWVQSGLGLRSNFTRHQNAIEKTMLFATGDPARYDASHITNLIDNDVNFAMVYGDRDYRCNWISAENASLHIDFESKSEFAKAGYASIHTNSSYDGGFVREVNGLSFSRVFQAGHSAGGYQPETVGAIFDRTIFGFDVATGKIDLGEHKGYSTEGKTSVRDVPNKLPEPIDNVCYVLYPGDTCKANQLEALENGSAETKNWVVTSPAGGKGTRFAAGSKKEGGEKGTEDQGDGDDDGKKDGPKTVESSATQITTVSTFISILVLTMAVFLQ